MVYGPSSFVHHAKRMNADDVNRFGVWLKARRELLGLTQKELAHAVGCSVSNLRKMEAGERRPSRQLAEMLATHLQIVPEEHGAFMRLVWESRDPGLTGALPHQPLGPVGSPTPGAALPIQATYPPTIASERYSPPTNLPASVTSFVGREELLARVRTLLRRADIRLLTLTGPGGVGKTRLATEAADSLLHDFPDGVFMVPLATVNDPSAVVPAVLRTLELRVAQDVSHLEALKARLAGKRLLLFLDNFEQVLEASAALSELLAASAGLKIVVTSRMPLHLYGEHKYLVPPMEISVASPDDSSRSAHRQTMDDGRWTVDDHSVLSPQSSSLATVEAVRLFVERAEAANPSFELTEENAAYVAEICRRLDGLPLAIELAAARSGLLSPQALLARLSSRLEMLGGGPAGLPTRHRSLRDTIGWSYDLLDPGEQQLFRRMAVFHGGRTIEALEAVCGRTKDEGRRTKDGTHFRSSSFVLRPLEIDVLEGAESLVSKNLLQVREGGSGETRFWMLGTIHEYAREKLVESGESNALGNRHAAYFLALAEEADGKLRGREQLRWLDRLEDEHDNLRAAHRWAVQHGNGEVALRLVAALGLFWRIRSYLSEGRERAAAALALPGPPLLRARALCVQGNLAGLQGDYVAAPRAMEESLIIAQEVGSKADLAFALYSLGRSATYQDDYPAARSYLERSLALWQELGDRWNSAMAISALGYMANREGDWQAFDAHATEAVRILRDLGDTWAMARALNNLGVTLRMYHADYKAALEVAEETLTLCHALGDKQGIGLSLGNIALAAQARGDFATARHFQERALEVFKDTGFKLKAGETYASLSEISREQGDYIQAETFAEQSLHAHEEVGDKGGVAYSLQVLGLAVAYRGDYDRALSLLERCEQIYTELDSLDMGEAGVENIATVARWRGQPGDLERADAVLARALAWRNAHESTGNRAIAAVLTYERGMVAWQRGEREVAERSIRGALSVLHSFGWKYQLALCFSALAAIEASGSSAREAMVRAARLAGAAGALFEATGATPPPADQAAFDKALAQAHERLSEAGWQRANDHGAAMPVEDAVAYALDS
jgi:predicted ATPase/transcriptional regulator with XRE-family HTH domain